MLLELAGVHVGYGPRTVVHGVDLAVEQGEIVSLVGANGAGKTTILRSIIGLNPPARGTVTFDGRPVHRLDTAEIVALGIALSPEGRRVFPHMSVQDNLFLGGYLRPDKAAKARTLDLIFETFPRLRERRTQNAGLMSGGEQQMLAIGRALMAQPKLLLLDEPSLGLAPLMVKEIARIVRKINGETGLSIILVEQNARMALRLCHRGHVLESGKVAVSGTGAELLASEYVRSAYLGV
jgi:branched-chain amino acid transport system ATP-binding protein